MATIAEKSVAHIDMRKAAEADLDKRIGKYACNSSYDSPM